MGPIAWDARTLGRVRGRGKVGFGQVGSGRVR